MTNVKMKIVRAESILDHWFRFFLFFFHLRWVNIMRTSFCKIHWTLSELLHVFFIKCLIVVLGKPYNRSKMDAETNKLLKLKVWKEILPEPSKTVVCQRLWQSRALSPPNCKCFWFHDPTFFWCKWCHLERSRSRLRHLRLCCIRCDRYHLWKEEKLMNREQLSWN